VISAVVETIECHKQMHLFAIINSFYANWLSFNKILEIAKFGLLEMWKKFSLFLRHLAL